ncbi:hypothetical protein [Paenibacillus sp.]|uniref:hypothetical protein n=1 Tax=Paenibacillus sp. TaxID=58172 RepID=UPI0028AB8A47|nr:hypothetical protein [Paenibacillus sp.]
MPELQRLSGRLPVPIKEGLALLAQENYIQWVQGMPPETAIIIEGWERPDPRVKRHEVAPQGIQWGIDGSNIEYWTDY